MSGRPCLAVACLWLLCGQTPRKKSHWKEQVPKHHSRASVSLRELLFVFDMHVHTCYGPECGQEDNSQELIPSTVWVPGSELRDSGLGTRVLTCRVISPLSPLFPWDQPLICYAAKGGVPERLTLQVSPSVVLTLQVWPILPGVCSAEDKTQGFLRGGHSASGTPGSANSHPFINSLYCSLYSPQNTKSELPICVSIKHTFRVQW